MKRQKAGDTASRALRAQHDEVWDFSPTAKETDRHRDKERARLAKHRDLHSVPSTLREARHDADAHIPVQAHLILTPQKVHPKLTV